jgi:hypothetical protein
MLARRRREETMVEKRGKFARGGERGKRKEEKRRNVGLACYLCSPTETFSGDMKVHTL